MKKLTRNNLKKIKGGSGDIGNYCGTPNQETRGSKGEPICPEREAPIYDPESNCCLPIGV